MTLSRARQQITAPLPIPPKPTEHERLRVLRHVATTLPLVTARHGIRMIGKGGTMLALADGLTRPSTDYDADTDKPLSKPEQQRLMQRVMRSVPGIRDPKVTWSGHRNHAVLFSWTQARTGITAGSFLNVTTRNLENARHQAWRLTDPVIENTMVREVDGMPVYTTRELMRGKAGAFMNRGRARDTYDVAWALATRLDEIDPETRITLDRFMKTGTSDEQWDQWRDDYRSDPIMSRAPGLDAALAIISDCLELDPVVRCAREPDHVLDFWVDETRISLNLAGPTGHEPPERLFTVPRTELHELADFVIGSGADLSQRLGMSPEELRREGGDGVTRILSAGLANFERDKARAQTR